MPQASTYRGKQKVGIWAHHLSPPATDVFFAHFDAISEDRWVEKWRRRISKERISEAMSDRRQQQQSLVERAIADGTAGTVFRKLYGLTRIQKAILSRLGVLTRADVLRGQ